MKRGFLASAAVLFFLAAAPALFFTGCGMPDKVADLMREMDVESFYTRDEMAEKIEEEEKNGGRGRDVWVVSEEKRQDAVKLDKLFAKARVEKLVVKSSSDDESSFVMDYLNNPKDGDYEEGLGMFDAYNNTYAPCISWTMEFADENSLLTFAKLAGGEGFSDVRLEIEKFVSDEKKERRYSKIKWKGLSIGIEKKKKMYAEVGITLEVSAICYPSLLEQAVSAVEGDVSIDRYGIGYLDGMFLSDWSQDNPGYSTDCWRRYAIYFQDGKPLQIDVKVMMGDWQTDETQKTFMATEVTETGDGQAAEDEDGKPVESEAGQAAEDGETESGAKRPDLKKREKFFVGNEKQTLKNFLLMMGAPEAETDNFLDTAGRTGGDSGKIGTVGWYMKKEGEAEPGEYSEYSDYSCYMLRFIA